MKTPTRNTSLVEILESRIAPAFAFFTDVDGDIVKVTTSKGTNADLQTIVDTGENMGQMETFALTSTYAGSSVAFSVVTRGAAGDGMVNVWYINATGIDLGAVTVAGDLGKLSVGDTIYSNGSVKSVKVQSIGVNGGATDKVWDMKGSTVSFAVAGDVNGATLAWSIPSSDNLTVESVTIGGNLTGGTTNDSGSVQLSTTGGTSELKSISVGGNLAATNYDRSGAIIVGGVGSSDPGIIGKASVGGSLKGVAAKLYSGAIYASTSIGSVSVGGSLNGGGQGSGSISSGGRITGSVSVGGSLIGGAGAYSGCIFAFYGIAGPVTVGKLLSGGSGAFGGAIGSTLGSVGNVTVGTYLSGGSGVYSGAIYGETGLGNVKVGGSVYGGSNDYAGSIATGLGTNHLAGDITVMGDLNGGSDIFTGFIGVGSAGKIYVAGSLKGGSTVGVTGSIYALETVSSIFVGGDLEGSTQSHSGDIRVHGGGNGTAKLSSVTIGGSLLGDAGVSSGAIQIEGSVDKFTIGGGIAGGSASYAGSLGFGSVKTLNIGTGFSVVASIYGGSANYAGTVTGDTLGTAVLAGDIVGGSSPFTGSFVITDTAANITIGGSVSGGSSFSSGYVQVQGSKGLTGKLTVGGDLNGSPDLTGTGFLQASGGSANAIEIKGSILGGDSTMAGKFNSGAVLVAGTLKSMIVGGNIEAGNYADKSNFNLGAVRAGSIGTMLVKGSLVGANASSRVAIVGEGVGTNVAIKSLTVLGSVSNAMILGGYDLSGTTVNGNGASASNSAPQIGTVTIYGDFFNGSIATGVDNNTNAQGNWADGTNVLIDANNTLVASIAKVVIKGSCFASTQSGISAELIKSLTVGGIVVPIGTGAQSFAVSGNFKVQQVVA